MLVAPAVLAAGLSAQIICTLGPGASAYKQDADQRPTADAMELAGRVNSAVKTVCGTNCPQVAVFRNETVANVMLMAKGGEARLVYAPKFFSAAYDSFGDGGIIALIAHELGHALDDTMGAAWIQSAWPPELRADAWAGCALAKAGLGPSELAAALAALEKYPSSAHPRWDQRLPVLRTGYTRCGGDGSKLGVMALRN